MELAESHSRKWHRALQYEREQRVRLEETIEQLAKQHNSLERACRGAPGLSSNATGIPSSVKGTFSSYLLSKHDYTAEQTSGKYQDNRALTVNH